MSNSLKKRKQQKLQSVYEGDGFEAPLKIVLRPYQKRILLSVKPNGSLLLTANKSIGKKEMYAFVQKNEAWIKGQLEHFKVFRQKFPQKSFEPGEPWLFMGRNYPLTFLDTDSSPRVLIRDFHLLLEGKSVKNMPPEKIQKQIFLFYRKAATEIIGQRFRSLSSEWGFKYKSLKFKTLSARWGSCNNRGEIVINWKLIAAPPPVMDYVLIHELCHLEHQNHSPVFWSAVEKIMPDYKAHKKWLRDNSYTFDFLNIKSEFQTDDALTN